jgi:hypothetical protein
MRADQDHFFWLICYSSLFWTWSSLLFQVLDVGPQLAVCRYLVLAMFRDSLAVFEAKSQEREFGQRMLSRNQVMVARDFCGGCGYVGAGIQTQEGKGERARARTRERERLGVFPGSQHTYSKVYR